MPIGCFWLNENFNLINEIEINKKDCRNLIEINAKGKDKSLRTEHIFLEKLKTVKQNIQTISLFITTLSFTNYSKNRNENCWDEPKGENRIVEIIYFINLDENYIPLFIKNFENNNKEKYKSLKKQWSRLQKEQIKIKIKFYK